MVHGMFCETKTCDHIGNNVLKINILDVHVIRTYFGSILWKPTLRMKCCIMRSLYLVISRPCGPKYFMGISRPWSRNFCSMYVERGENLGEMLSNFSET